MLTRMLTAAALLAALATNARADDPKGLSEAQRLKAPLLAAQMEALETHISLDQAKLQILKRAAQDLEREYLDTVKAPAGSTWDWARMVPVPPPAAPATPKP